MNYRDGYYIECALEILQKRGEYNVEFLWGVKEKVDYIEMVYNIDMEYYIQSQVVFQREDFSL